MILNKIKNINNSNGIGVLYIVGTPIGNLEDITLRAITTLKNVDYIFCERILHAKKLLKHYNINTPLKTYASYTPHREVKKAINLLLTGKDIAMISDAGTPTISDPGVKMVHSVYEELKEKAMVRCIPGPSAVVSALSCSGAPSSGFVFLGFLPKKHGVQKILSNITEATTVLYESPHRLLKTLVKIKEHIETQREVIVAREITKIYESYIRGNIETVITHFVDNPQEQKGECVIIISSLIVKK